MKNRFIFRTLISKTGAVLCCHNYVVRFAKSDAGPSADEYLIKRLLSKPPGPEVRARIMRWLFCSNLPEWLKGVRGF